MPPYAENESGFPTEMKVTSVYHPQTSLQNLIRKVKLYSALKLMQELAQLAAILNFYHLVYHFTVTE
jgi:hypothetical protein